MKKLNELFNNIDNNCEVNGIKINSKDVKKGDIFVCTMGVTADRHDFIDEAIENNIDLIITHHPFILKKMNKINTMDLKGKLIHKLIKNDIALYSMHTNFDIAYDGLNDYFMKLMGFENSKVLEVTNTETLYKLAVYVPNTHVDKVKNALSDAGAGHIGNYSHCSFSSQGIGSFKPLDNANPYIGSLGEVELVEEVKIETIVPNKTLGGGISSMIKAHPYEEVAYDIYKLENKENIYKAYGNFRAIIFDNKKCHITYNIWHFLL